jgi:hypothetical protein
MTAIASPRPSYLTTLALLSLATASALGCGGGGGSSTRKVTQIRAHLVDSSTAGASAKLRAIAVEAPPEIEALFLEGLDVTAFTYRPGEPIQNSRCPFGEFASAGDCQTKDWSVWPIGDTRTAPSQGPDESNWTGTWIARGGSLDLHPTSGALDGAFVDGAGKFAIDMLAVHLYSPGVRISAAEASRWAAYQYTPPDDPYVVTGDDYLSDPSAASAGGVRALTSLEGVRARMQQDVPEGDDPTRLSESYMLNITDVTGYSFPWVVLFARSDWFPRPMSVYLKTGTPWGLPPGIFAVHQGGEVLWASEALTAQQQTILDSLSSDVYGSFWTQLVVLIVPFGGPVQVDLAAAGADPAGGAASGDLDVTFDFDLAGVLGPDTRFQAYWDDPVISFRGDGYGIPFGLSLELSANGVPLAMAPPPPDLDVVPTSSSSAIVRLRDNSSYETGFTLERAGADGVYAVTGSAQALPGSGATLEFPVTGLDPAQAYSWRATASAGTASATSPVVVTTLGQPPRPPGALAVTGRGLDQFQLVWSDESSQETGYQLTRKTAGSADVIIQLPVGATSYRDKGLARGTAYTYSLIALGAPGIASSTAVAATATTLSSLPTPTFTLVSYESVDGPPVWDVRPDAPKSLDYVFYPCRYRPAGSTDDGAWIYNQAVNITGWAGGYPRGGVFEFQCREVLFDGYCNYAKPVTASCTSSAWSATVTTPAATAATR